MLLDRFLFVLLLSAFAITINHSVEAQHLEADEPPLDPFRTSKSFPARVGFVFGDQAVELKRQEGDRSKPPFVDAAGRPANFHSFQFRKRGLDFPLVAMKFLDGKQTTYALQLQEPAQGITLSFLFLADPNSLFDTTSIVYLQPNIDWARALKLVRPSGNVDSTVLTRNFPPGDYGLPALADSPALRGQGFDRREGRAFDLTTDTGAAEFAAVQSELDRCGFVGCSNLSGEEIARASDEARRKEVDFAFLDQSRQYFLDHCSRAGILKLFEPSFRHSEGFAGLGVLSAIETNGEYCRFDQGFGWFDLRIADITKPECREDGTELVCRYSFSFACFGGTIVDSSSADHPVCQAFQFRELVESRFVLRDGLPLIKSMRLLVDR